jgi:hypothetical protein
MQRHEGYDNAPLPTLWLQYAVFHGHAVKTMGLEQ